MSRVVCPVRIKVKAMALPHIAGMTPFEHLPNPLER